MSSKAAIPRHSKPKGKLREYPLILKRLEVFYKKINNRSGNRIAIIRRSFQTFEKARASQASAGLAYYALFSMFPLLLVLIAGGSYFLNDQQAYDKVSQLVQASVPGSSQWIDENLRQVLNVRGTVGVIGLLTLLWSASGFFTNLAYNINLAWPEKPQRNFLKNRLVGLEMITGLIGLLLLALAFESLTSLVPFVNINSSSPPDPVLWQIISGIGSWLTVFLLFLALYRWIPTARVSWAATLLGALTVSIGWKIATEGFAWYLRSGLGRYQLVYGSLGAIVAFLFLIFILSLITLYGAHLCAAADNEKQA
jgi:membrane protein